MGNEPNNYNYTPPPVYYQQVPPPENNRGKGCGGCLTGLGVLIVALTIAFLTIFFVVKPQVDQMIADMGGTNIKQLFSLYKEVTTRVNEKDIVTHGFSNTDYNTAKNKLINAGYNIFDDNGNILPDKLNKENIKNQVELTDKEFAALLNNVLVDFLADANIPFYQKLKLNATAKQIKINSTLEANKFKVTLICAVNTDELTSQMGILGGLIPQALYLTSQATYSFDDNKLTFTDSQIKLNKIKDSSFQELLNIINKSVAGSDEPIALQDFSDAIATLVCDGFNLLPSKTNLNINLKDGGIILEQSDITDQTETPPTPIAPDETENNDNL